MWSAIKLWLSHSRERRLLFVAAALAAFNGVLLAVVLTMPGDTGPMSPNTAPKSPQESPRGLLTTPEPQPQVQPQVLQPKTATIILIETPVAARFDKELRAALAYRASVWTAIKDNPPCTYCAGLDQAFELFSSRAASALSDIRALERQLGRARPPHAEQEAKSPLIVRRQTAERAVGRAIAAIRLLTDKAAQCRRENFCAAGDAALREETGEIECDRDGAALEAARTRLTQFALAVSARAEICRTQACPAMECSAGLALEADLAAAGRAVEVVRRQGTERPGAAQEALMSTGRALLQSIRPEFEQIGRGLDDMKNLLNDGLADPRDIGEAVDFLARLDGLVGHLIDQMDRPWGTGGPSPIGLGEGLWRLRLVALNVQTMLDDTRVALDRAGGGQASAGADGTGGQDDLALRLLPRFTDALLDVARLKAVFGLADRLAAMTADPPGACTLDGWVEAAARLSEARAGLSLCLARSVCRPVSEQAASPSLNDTGPLTSLSALRLIDDRQRFDLARARIAATDGPAGNILQGAGGVGLFTSRSTFQTGEVIQVTAEMADAACLAEGGTVALVRDTDHATVRRYKLDGPPAAALLFEAPGPAGRYRIEAHAPAERGGGAIASVAVDIEPLPPGCSGFTGTWSSDFGDLQLVERDREVTGTYRRMAGGRPGFLIGERAGRELTGIWLSELGAGGTRLVLSSGGGRFTGTWSHHLTRTAGTGIWNGTCRTER